jgi:hypothetical protein
MTTAAAMPSIANNIPRGSTAALRGDFPLRSLFTSVFMLDHDDTLQAFKLCPT